MPDQEPTHVWTDVRPEVAGWYWWHHPKRGLLLPDGPAPQAVKLFREYDEWCWAGAGDHDWYTDRSDSGGHWSGPIPTPEAPSP